MYNDFMPAVEKFTDDLAERILRKKSVSASLATASQEKMLTTITDKYEALSAAVAKLEADTAKAEELTDELEKAKFYHDPVFTDMEDIRTYADFIEKYIPDEYLPYPTYSKMLFYV